MKTTIARILFFIVAGVEIFSEINGSEALEFISKPLMMPALMFYVLASVKNKNEKVVTWLYLALALSWVGDVTLMLTPKSPEDVSMMGVPKNQYLFFAGLIGFFIAHVFYIKIYLQHFRKGGKSLFEKNKLLFLPILIYAVVLLYIVIPPVYSHPEKSLATIPVIFYAAILSSMVGFALNRYQNTHTKSFWLVLTGSVLFLLSDSGIALNFLATENGIPYGELFIMSTYLAAQYLIVEGLIRHSTTK